MTNQSKTYEKYSVLMSVYKGDKAEYFKRAVDSMLNQTAKPDQIVIVVDGPVDPEVKKCINEYKDSGGELFTIVPFKKNRGLGKALDEGIKYCRNELVARMDADDISIITRCEEQLKVFNTYPSVSIVSGTIGEFVDDPENIISYRTVPETHADIRQRMRIRSGFNHPAVMYKKDDVILSGGYGSLRRKQDHDLFSRMLNNGCRGYNIQDTILLFRSDIEAYKRKKSWKNVSGYITAQWNCFKRREVSLSDLLFVVFGELFFMIVPCKAVSKITKRFFRE